MVADADDFPDDVMEDVAYLSRSESRGRILDALASEPRSSGELADATGIARTTVSRIVNEFEERGWAERRNDGNYATTPTGERVVDEFKPFLRSMEAIGNLGDLVAWLPTDEVPIDLHHFADATVNRPDPTNPMSTIADFNSRLDGVSEFRCLVGIAPPIPFERAMRDGVVSDDLYTEHVITDEELDYLLDQPDRLPRWREYVEAGANLYCYDGQVPCNVFVFDDTVIISNSKSDYGDPHVGIESDNEAVRSWAHEVIEEHRENARRLDSEVFATESAG